jgi:hypothetical protein
VERASLVFAAVFICGQKLDYHRFGWLTMVFDLKGRSGMIAPDNQ